MDVVMRDGETAGRRGGISSGARGRLRRLVWGAFALAFTAAVGCAANEPPLDVARVVGPAGEQDLRNAPCQVVTRDMVSRTFSIPAAEIEQSSMSSLCGYRWEGEGKLLDVTVHVSAITEHAAQARALFQEATGATAAPGQPRTARLTGPFEVVDGLGDQALIDTRNGDVHVRRDRLYFTLNAYHGPAMPDAARPALIETVAGTRAQWQQNTLSERRQAATDLARASIGPDENH